MAQPPIRTTSINAFFPAPNSRPPTRGEENIEVARRQSLRFYHLPSVSTQRLEQLTSWYPFSVVDQSIGPRIQDLYHDRTIHNRQRALFIKLAGDEYAPTLQQNYDVAEVRADYNVTDRRHAYEGILDLYRERQTYIQDAGVERLSVWTDWWAEKMKPGPMRDEGVVAACESTISFLEDDYIRRKVDFATEVYAILEKAGDAKRARMVVDDLGELFPWLKRGFCRRLLNSVVSYHGLKGKLPQV